MSYLCKLLSYEIVDVIESAVSDIDFDNTDYDTISYFHGLPIDLKNEHKNDGEKLPVIFLFEPLELESNIDEMETVYKSGTVTLYFMDRGTKYKKAKQTSENYGVIDSMGDVVNAFMVALESQKEVSDITDYNETNWPDWSVNVEQKSGNNTTQQYMYQNLTGKEISFTINTHKIYNC